MYYSRSDLLETPLFAIPVNFVQETQRQHVKARITGNGFHHNTASKTEVELRISNWSWQVPLTLLKTADIRFGRFWFIWTHAYIMTYNPSWVSLPFKLFRWQSAKLARIDLSTGTTFRKFWPILTELQTKTEQHLGKNRLTILLFTYTFVE